VAEGGRIKMDNLTPEQIENYRKMLITQLGPYALIMPVDKIEAYRKRMQSCVDELAKENKDGHQP
jgi:hypothetical protein